jgi:GNAT superfamily N-acetyltransferase
MDIPNQDNHLSFQPLNSSNFGDFEFLFNEKNACEGCWCMYWRLHADEFEESKGENNRQKMKAMVEAGEIPGVIAYNDNEPVAWCSFGDRDSFPRFSRAYEIQMIKDEEAWIISCLFVRRDWRRSGVKRALLSYLVDYCAEKGGKVLDGFPCDSTFSKYPDAFAWTGITKAYEAVGFVQITGTLEKRPIMRYYL